MSIYIKGFSRITKKDDLEQFNGKEFYSVVIYGSESVYHPPYDPGESSYSTSEPRVYHYATADKSVLNQAIIKLVEEKASFVFFTTKLASFKITTTVDVE